MANDILIQQVRELKSLKLMAKELADEIAKLETSLKTEMESRQTETNTPYRHHHKRKVYILAQSYTMLQLE